MRFRSSSLIGYLIPVTCLVLRHIHAMGSNVSILSIVPPCMNFGYTDGLDSQINVTVI